MKAILEFDLNDFDGDDRQSFNDAINGSNWKMSMWELDQWLRSETKHAPDNMSDDTYNALILCREKLHEIINEHSLNFD